MGCIYYDPLKFQNFGSNRGWFSSGTHANFISSFSFGGIS